MKNIAYTIMIVVTTIIAIAALIICIKEGRKK